MHPMLGKNGKKKWIIAAVALILVLLVGGITAWRLLSSDDSVAVKPTTKPTSLSAWVVDWQAQAGTADYEQIAGHLASVQVFAAYFDEADQLYMTEQGKELLTSITKTAHAANDTDVYLTLVNDQFQAGKPAVQKSPELVSRLMADDSSREQHIAEIMELVSQYEMDGIEIDYEQVPEQDWPGMLQFIEELQQKLSDAGKKLRIVLEPQAPIEELQFPEGPTYVMMAYNLYGTHSKAGPKADAAFITKIAKRMQYLPGDPVIALSAGGFDWADSGEVTSITQEKAEQIAQSHLNSLRRDEASSSVHYKYVDDKEVSHTVWYADHMTMKRWIETARAAGIHQVAIWRLGELGELSLHELQTE